MKIEILGTGCNKCTAMFELTKKAIAQKGIFAQVEKVDDLNKIMDYGVMNTPGFVVNGEVKSTGKVLTLEDITSFIS